MDLFFSTQRVLRRSQNLLGLLRVRSKRLQSCGRDKHFADSYVKISVMDWVEKWVVQNGLCPWAGKVLHDGKLRCVVIDRSYSPMNKTIILNKIVLESENLLESNAGYESTLIVLPKVDDFNIFLRLVQESELRIKGSKLSDKIQVASFHPDYQFRDTCYTDVENYTNRSPFAVIHLLQVSHVSQAIEQMNGRTDVIWKGNISKMKKLGSQKVLELQRSIKLDLNARYGTSITRTGTGSGSD
jgi:uncharacterized protein